ncbi:hypothetical protein HU200_035804 [Digitaria exilis]|uniref:Uncharacterized protein n=1 Tax=Digitaria exilis TaxID=1010633 RepID=A0A835BFU7_9POAL|nr:hypothetical protein HU200_035804 [Digitaria exilis]CAB3466987.1 unnamed protein product [Digitaria exilis]
MDRRDDAHDAASWLVGAGFLVLTLSSGAAVYRAAGDPATVSFVVASYVTLLLLFACLRAYERSPPAAGRGRIRAAVWSLTTLLTAMFAWRVAAVMPYWSAALLVWALAGATTVGGFFAMFYRP